MADTFDPYKTLQVDSEAEDEVVQAAYRRLARKYHPDVAPGAEAAARMAAINAAWERIGDPVKRALYDRERAAQARAASRAAGGDAAAPSSSADASRPTAGASGPGSRPPEEVSGDWTSGRSTHGGGYDDSMRRSDGHGAAGPPPGRPSGTVLTFGRYAGWSMGEIARTDLEYLEWLDRAPIGRNYRDEIDQLLRASGRRRTATAKESGAQRGLYRRR
jgi:curved DNA-binding protein CbpA